MTRDEILAANPIADFVRSRGHALRPAGENLETSGCPATQHKRGHRPVTIYPHTQSWSCHDCKVGGTVIDWTMIERKVTAADALQILGGGAGKWRDDYSESLRGKDVVIFADDDAPGRAHADQVIEALTGIARSIKRVTLPDGFHDISDYIASLPRDEATGVIAELVDSTPFGP